jgi:hypothetical protein
MKGHHFALEPVINTGDFEDVFNAARGDGSVIFVDFVLGEVMDLPGSLTGQSESSKPSSHGPEPEPPFTAS